MSNIFIATLNPTVCAVLAVALLVFWHNQRERTYIGVLGAAFTLLALGFAAQIYSVSTDGLISRLFANGLLVLGAAGVVIGTLGRHGRKPPPVPLTGIVVASIAGFCWFLFVDPSVVARILIVNFGCGLLMLVLAAELWRVDDQKPIDRFLFGLFAVWGLSFFLRTPLAVAYDGTDIINANFFATLYWITLTFSIALFLLIYAVAIIAAIAIDLNEELRAESCTDSLSGLLNRRGFESRVHAILEDKPSSVALIMADLDHFKHVNDRFGHAAGDNAIVSFARCLRDALGEEHLAGRVGGEEFAVLLRGVDIRMARLFAEGLRSSFAALEVSGLPPGHALTASFGVAVLQPGEDWEGLLKRADRALYRSKAEGRDRVVVCTNADGSDRQPSVRSGAATAAQPGS